jgi:predicted methyltransferase
MSLISRKNQITLPVDVLRAAGLEPGGAVVDMWNWAGDVDIGIFDPDLDPDGRLAAELTDTVVAGLGPRAGFP